MIVLKRQNYKTENKLMAASSQLQRYGMREIFGVMEPVRVLIVVVVIEFYQVLKFLEPYAKKR